MQKLPIGEQNFSEIRQNNAIYIDKTKHLQTMIENGKYYFLSRPRRFGKSLTISILEAMFQGRAELFKGLYAEKWVKKQEKNPNPVIKLDMSGLGDYENIKEFKASLKDYLGEIIYDYNLDIKLKETASRIFANIITRLYKKFGSVVVLMPYRWIWQTNDR